MFTGNTFLPGHRIRVEISSSNFPLYDRNLNSGGKNAEETNPVRAVNTIYHSRQYPSKIRLNLYKP
jgi:predicted acyl esterase